MELVGLLILGGALVAAAVGAVAVAVGRNRTRRNRVVPEVATDAPAAWAGAHTPEARLHRRLRDAVDAGRAVPDADGGLIQARVEIEQSALAIDAHLVALSRLAERERAGRLREVESNVASVEEAVARLADAARVGRESTYRAVDHALDRATLLAEARRELDRRPEDVLDDLLGQPVAEDDEEPPRAQGMPG